MQKITAVAFLYNDWKLFLAKRAETKKFLPWKFELPWGHIEFGEEVEDGLKREINEEFNINVVIGDPFYVFTYTNNENTKHTVEIVYFVKLKDKNQKISLNPLDHSEYKWVNSNELQIYLEKNDNEYKAAIKWFDILEWK